MGPDCVDDGHFRFFPPFLFPIFSLSRFNSLDLMRPATSVFDFPMFFPFDRSLLYFIPDLGLTMLGSVIVIKVFRAFLSWRKDTGRVSASVASRNGFLSSVVTDADIFFLRISDACSIELVGEVSHELDLKISSSLVNCGLEDHRVFGASRFFIMPFHLYVTLTCTLTL